MGRTVADTPPAATGGTRCCRWSPPSPGASDDSSNVRPSAAHASRGSGPGRVEIRAPPRKGVPWRSLLRRDCWRAPVALVERSSVGGPCVARERSWPRCDPCATAQGRAAAVARARDPRSAGSRDNLVGRCARIDWYTTIISVLLSVTHRRRYLGNEKKHPDVPQTAPLVKW